MYILFQARPIINMVYNYTIPRGPVAAQFSSPGPIYGLPSLVGQTDHDPRSHHAKGPAYAFGVRHGKYRDDSGPGPAYYPNPKIHCNGYECAPHYSIAGRHREPSLYRVPGPGAYSPEKVGRHAKPNPPEYSFGLRHWQPRTDNTPGLYSISTGGHFK